ncbi:MAG: hypothetical protein JZU65_05585 [Chlorobium sp.]|nr:hypothetical protein [Chlorobium sp.]
MANVGNSNTPMGLRPVSTLGSAGYMGRIQTFVALAADTTAIGIGDPVVMTGTADADGIPVVTRLTQAGTTAIVGAVVGVVPNPADLTLSYRKASTLMKVMVDTDPMTVYEIADSNGVQTTCIAATDVGNNATLSLGTVDTTTGNGKTVLGTTIGTTTTLNVKILGLSPKVGNAIGDYAKYLVLINNHQFRAGTAGI